MGLTIVSYAYVEPGGPPPQMQVHPTSAEVRTYLGAHVDALLAKAEAGSLSPALFRSNDSCTRFGGLMTGPKAKFLTASQDLADRLFARMDQRSRRGFFITLRRSGPALGAALKLDVRDAAAAAMRLDNTGQPTLEAVKDLLDIPGELQKGAIVPDNRPGSDLIVGDKLVVTSLYFLDALDAEQHAAAGPATADFLRVVQAVAPAKAAATAAALERETKVSPVEFFERHENLLNDDERAAVLDRARVRRRPIDAMDPGNYVLREEIEADGIVIRGRAATIREKLQISERPGGYRIQIDVDEAPRRRYL